MGIVRINQEHQGTSIRRKSFSGNDMHYWSYAYNKVFKKIGATSFSFEVDPSGTLLGGSSAYMTPRDWARFGQLYLQVQLVPSQQATWDCPIELGVHVQHSVL